MEKPDVIARNPDNMPSLRAINDKVVSCRRCPRLVEYTRQVGQVKVKRHASEQYWARPLPSFGDPAARLLIVGLAPAAHGGNRTGRMFTGDSSGDWVAKALCETGFANIPTSRSSDDGFALRDAYITAAVRCAPPANKPLPSEIAACSDYLAAELDLLQHVRVIVALGRIAFDAYCKVAGLRGLRFSHASEFALSESDRNGRRQVLISSYHPSRQNTNTGRLTWPMWVRIFQSARRIIEA